MTATLQGIKQRFGIIGKSPLLDRALSTAQRVASTELTVLIQGESGVGKEVFSRIIHELSPRKHNKFIAINCGAIPGGTINSELFGHEKGSFTGATGERKGYFETVNGGTIFLDEIGEMPLDTQAYLLRVLESGEFIRVGSSKVQKTNVRVIAATNVDLISKVKEGKFREDLYYRLNTVPIKVPSLKERREDIYMLLRKFAVDFSEKYSTDSIRLSEEARRAFEIYPWPGNIRELRNVVEQLSVLSEEKLIDLETLSDIIPNLFRTHLPAKTDTTGTPSFEEREILYKFLFEMKNDLNDLKSLVYQLISYNNLNVPDRADVNKLRQTIDNPRDAAFDDSMERDGSYGAVQEEDIQRSKPIILNQNRDPFQHSEEVVENLSLEEMEKEFIKKALKKYKGRRKDAAEELGISERTLYRKINQYEIEE